MRVLMSNGSIFVPKAILLFESTHQGLIQKDPICEKFFRPQPHFLDPFLKMTAKMPGLVTPTFFLWEITHKFFFFTSGFSYPGNPKNQFSWSCGVPMGPWGLWGHFRAKNGYFSPIFHIIRFFLAF